MAEGVRLVRQQLADLLHRRGLEPIAAEPGDAFDPHVHEALSNQPSEFPEGTIAAVWQRGYKLGARVVRPARVVVSSGPGRRRGRLNPRWQRTTTRRLACRRARARTRSRRPTASWPASTTRMRIRATRRRRRSSSRSARRTTCCPIPRSASSTTSSASRSGRAPVRLPGLRLRLLRRARPTSIWATCSAASSTAAVRAAGRAVPQAQARGSDVEVQVALSFADALEGATVRVPVDKANTCPTVMARARRPARRRRSAPTARAAA